MASISIKRVLVIGLDCAAPRFVFEPGAFALPHLHGLMARGCWGPLRSCDPPITVPAWACMMSGRDPGALGCYGFRNRRDYTYEGMTTANARDVRVPRVWDILSRHGKKVGLVGVPQTYPPVPVNGWLAADFLAPDARVEYTYPKSLKAELERAIGEYQMDVKDFRTEDKERLRAAIFAFMNNRFDAAQHLLRTKPWDFFMMVDMGVDRLHHGFWKYIDSGHPRYVPGNPFVDVFRDYYQALDARIGELLAQVGDETAVLVVSDHGARPMLGGVLINEWLIERGWLRLKERPAQTVRLEDCAIDWPNTRAWGSGGYYGRVFINVAGREPQGLVLPAEYEAFRAELKSALELLPGPDSASLGTIAHRPEDLYPQINGIPPDLFVYFGDLAWRAVGSVAPAPPASVYTFENDTGPDDANHDYYGIFIMDDRTGRNGVQLTGLGLMDVAPTILRLMGVDVPEEMQGRIVE